MTRQMTRRLGLTMLAAVLVLAGSGLLLRAEPPQAVNTWAPGGAVTDARTGAAAVPLDDGRTLVLGGRLADGTISPSVVVFDVASQAVTLAGALLQPRVNHTATLLADGRVLVAGGSLGTEIHAEVELFDPATGFSVPAGSMLQPRTRQAAARLEDGSVLLAGGTTASGMVLQSVERFDVTTGTSVPLGMLTTPRTGATATTLIDHRVLIAGGSDGAGDLASAEIYDPHTPALFTVTPTSLSVARSGHTALLLPENGSVLIAGGSSGGVPVTAVDLFLPIAFPDNYTYSVGEFAPAASLALPRARAASGPGASAGHAFVVGGGSADLERYRFATVHTDKDDYYPGETVYITGTGWTPGETVRLLLQEWDVEHEDRLFEPVADSAGRISESFVVEPHHLGVRFYLTASDSVSRAQMTFTDAPRIGSVTVGAQSPNPLVAEDGDSATYSVTVQRTQNGTVNGTMSIDGGLPAGVTAAFAPATWTAMGNNAFPTVTLTLTTDGSTLPGSFEFTVRAAAGTDVSTGGAGTLVVAAPTVDTTVDVGEASATYGDGAAALSASVSASSTVNIGTVTFTVREGATVIGTPVTSGTVSAGSVAVSYPLPSGTPAGSYTIDASYSGGTGFNASTASGTLDIARANATIDVTGLTGPYDGNPHGASGTAIGVNNETLTGLDLGASFTNVPGGTANWVFTDATGNYNDASGSVEIVITKADATIDVTGMTVTYDGHAHGASGTATGVNNETLAGLDLGDSFTNVPGGTANWVFTDVTGNYNNASGSVAIVIEKADATIVVNGMTVTYDGHAHGATGTATGVNNETLAGLDLGASFTNVPGGTAHWVFTDVTGNYNDDSGSVAISITPATLTYVATPVSRPFGTPNPAFTGTVIGFVNGETMGSATTGALAFSSPATVSSSVGSHPIVGGGLAALHGNYAFAQADDNASALSITAWDANGHGFYQPVGVNNSVFVASGGGLPMPTAATVWNAAKGGSTIPLKFNVYADGVARTALADISKFQGFQLGTCTAGAEGDEVDFVTTGNTTLRYDTGERQFIQNWKTPSVARDTCYMATVTFADGSTLSAFFKLRR